MAVQQMVAPAGIKLEVKTVPWAVFNSTVYKKKALYINNWFGRATIDETLYPYFRTGGGWNEGNFSKPSSTGCWTRAGPPWTWGSARRCTPRRSR